MSNIQRHGSARRERWAAVRTQRYQCRTVLRAVCRPRQVQGVGPPPAGLHNRRLPGDVLSEDHQRGEAHLDDRGHCWRLRWSRAAVACATAAAAAAAAATELHRSYMRAGRSSLPSAARAAVNIHHRNDRIQRDHLHRRAERHVAVSLACGREKLRHGRRYAWQRPV